MPLHPQIEDLLNQIAAAGGKPTNAMTPEECRAVFDGLFVSLPPSQAKLAGVADRSLLGLAGQIRIRVYTPDGQGPFPVLVFFHGGGFVLGDLESHDSMCRELSGGANVVVVATDYRRSPEHRFPAAADDCIAVTRWVVKNASQINGDAERVAVGGDSAGGNLAAVVSQQLRDEDRINLAAQLLIYPATRLDGVATKSMVDNATGYLLLRDDMDWFRSHYLGPNVDGTDVRISPILAKDFSGLPPALVQTCEFDPLRDEGEDYGNALNAAGVPTVISRYDGSIHAAASFFTIMEPGRRMMDEAIRWLKEALRT